MAGATVGRAMATAAGGVGGTCLSGTGTDAKSCTSDLTGTYPKTPPLYPSLNTKARPFIRISQHYGSEGCNSDDHLSNRE
jgi:hypothetical protein